MQKELAIATFVYNEANQLPHWINHHLRQVESASDLWIIDRFKRKF